MTNQINHINQTNHINHINKTAIITGASRGIGAAIAKKLASCGYNLSLCCRNSSDRLKALADELHCAYGIEEMCIRDSIQRLVCTYIVCNVYRAYNCNKNN